VARQIMILDSQREKLMQNWNERLSTGRENHRPVVKLFNPMGAATWLLSEMNPDEPDECFGLCDLGMGCPELGYLNLEELREVRLPLGLYIERDIHFEATKTISEYAAQARELGRIEVC
jgi:Protein of unknown function (DUF2958)